MYPRGATSSCCQMRQSGLALCTCSRKLLKRARASASCSIRGNYLKRIREEFKSCATADDVAKKACGDSSESLHLSIAFENEILRWLLRQLRRRLGSPRLTRRDSGRVQRGQLSLDSAGAPQRLVPRPRGPHQATVEYLSGFVKDGKYIP